MRLPRGGCRFPGVGTALALGLGLALASPGLADVVDATPDSFTVQTVYEVEASPTQVYQAFVGNIGSWWHPDHTFSGEARNMSIDAAPSGCLCEKLPAGGIRHLTVVYVEAGKMIRLVGGLGPGSYSRAWARSLAMSIVQTIGVKCIVCGKKRTVEQPVSPFRLPSTRISACRLSQLLS